MNNGNYSIILGPLSWSLWKAYEHSEDQGFATAHPNLLRENEQAQSYTPESTTFKPFHPWNANGSIKSSACPQTKD